MGPRKIDVNNFEFIDHNQTFQNIKYSHGQKKLIQKVA